MFFDGNYRLILSSSMRNVTELFLHRHHQLVCKHLEHLEDLLRMLLLLPVGHRHPHKPMHHHPFG